MQSLVRWKLALVTIEPEDKIIYETNNNEHIHLLKLSIQGY